jgi:uncharacterized membrane protein YeaQ/YmgE (transglycosylase-associated protein family)
MITLETLLIWMLCGLIVGFIARLLMPGPQPIGLLATMLIGIVGAVVGGFLYALIRGPLGEPLAFAGTWQPWIVAIVGAMLVLWIFSAYSRRRTYYY